MDTIILPNNAYRWAEHIMNSEILPQAPTTEQVEAMLNKLASSPEQRRLIVDDEWLNDFYYCMEEDFGFAMPY